MFTPLTAAQVTRDLAIRDLTDPIEGPHALQQLIDDATSVLRASWGCAVRMAPGPRVVPLADNYDRLRFPPEAVTRDTRYTRYVDQGHMLRSHASAMVPPALRALVQDPADDVVLACPGITYRRDSIDRLHTGTPHQLDLWRIAGRRLDENDLEGMIRVLLDALAPGLPWRWEARVHPYTLCGRQVDVHAGSEWIEVWECGLAHPDVLAGAGLEGRTGLALGMGLDRLLMLRKQIPDIRLLRSDDPRVASQMLDLEPFRSVSLLPAVRRDLSVAVDGHDSVEDLGDRVREALGHDADAIESVAVLSQTTHTQLPAAAIDRLGMAPGQKNVLIRLVIRPLTHTLSHTEANQIRDRVYAALHRGAHHQWAGRSVPPPP